MTPILSQSDFDARFYEMSQLQDAAARLVLPNVNALISGYRLCGGTALSRFHLKHRISYDLDFFVPEEADFNAQALADRIVSRLPISNLELTHDPVKADQLHFLVKVGRSAIKISFVEDMYSRLFPVIGSGIFIEGAEIKTEAVEGLYHRKLRTVVAWAGGDAVVPAGGRQTARDMFDLFVLSKKVLALKPFIQSLPYAFPITAFEDGLARMPWFELSQELAETVAAPEWNRGKDVAELQSHLYEQIEMSNVLDDGDETEPESEDSSRSTKQSSWKRP